MSHPTPPFTPLGPVHRRRPFPTRADDDSDADTVEASLPSSPIAERRPSFSSDPTGKIAGYASDNQEGIVKDEEEATPLRELDPDEKQCRICFGGVDDEDSLGRLISPCLCSGSMRVSQDVPFGAQG